MTDRRKLVERKKTVTMDDKVRIRTTSYLFWEMELLIRHRENETHSTFVVASNGDGLLQPQFALKGEVRKTGQCIFYHGHGPVLFYRGISDFMMMTFMLGLIYEAAQEQLAPTESQLDGFELLEAVTFSHPEWTIVDV